MEFLQMVEERTDHQLIHGIEKITYLRIIK